jgi:Sulfatase
MSAADAAASAPPSAERRDERRSPAKATLIDFAHLAVLSTFALAQPLFDLLGDNPEFFAARGAPGFDIVSFAVLLVLLPPAVLLAIELLAGLIHRRVRDVLHLVFVGALVALIAAQALKKAFDASDTVLIALSVAIGAAAAFAYLRAEPVRSFLSVLSPAPLVFLALFLFSSPVSKLAFPDEASARSVGGVARAPVVVVLFDELPSLSLMDERGRVDARRFPAFGALARESTWFRNAYGVYDSTERAQPAIMDGNYPVEDKLPTSSDHPNSIFTLFAKTHRMNVSEEATAVCPRDLCDDERLDESYGDRMRSMSEDLGLVWLHVVSPPGIESDLASVSENWGNFGGGDGGGDQAGGGGQQSANVRSNLNRNRNKRFDSWIANVRASNKPSLNFKHTLLPHVPWQYLPSGKQYRRTARDPIPGLSSEAYNDQTQLDSLYQRHLLQLGFADRELGKLFRRLKQQGIYDDTLIVVAADHGLAFRKGERDRRKLTRENAEEIASIPLFVKAPGQTRGRIDDSLVESVDILPTIFDALDLDAKVKMDGRSAFSPAVRRRDTVRILERDSYDEIRISRAEWERRRRAIVERKLRLFGTGADGPQRLFRIGPDQQLLFRPVSDFTVRGGSGASFVAPEEYRNVDLRSPTVPVHVTGRLGDVPSGTSLAIAVNGRIEAVTRSLELAKGGEGVIFAAVVPEHAFRQGRNRVEVFSVSGSTLTRLGSA